MADAETIKTVDLSRRPAPHQKTQREIWDEWKAPDTLEECVKMFFEILDKKEISNNNVEFHPNRFNAEERVINSCRVWDTHRLGRIMPKMKELVKKSDEELEQFLITSG